MYRISEQALNLTMVVMVVEWARLWLLVKWMHGRGGMVMVDGLQLLSSESPHWSPRGLDESGMMMIG